MLTEHLWCPMHGWHNADQCPDRIIAAGVTTILTEEDPS